MNRHDVNYTPSSMPSTIMLQYDEQTFARNLFVLYQKIVKQLMTNKMTLRTCSRTKYRFQPTANKNKQKKEKIR